MSNQSNPFISETTPNGNRVDSLLNKLRERLKNFTVKNDQGEILGLVNDLVLDNNKQINLVVSLTNKIQSSNLVLIVSKLVQRIDPANKSVLVNSSKTETENLPRYRESAMSEMQFPENINNPVSNDLTNGGYHESDAIATTTDAPTTNVSTLEEVV